MKPKITKITIRALRILGLFLLFISLAFEALPLISSSSTLDTFQLMTRQRSFEERIAKSSIILAYRTSPDEHAEAINELQNTLPVWEEIQAGLHGGETSPELPSDVKLLITKVQPDFYYLDTAAHQVLMHPSNVDPVQISIILQHSQPYYLTMSQAALAFQDSIQNASIIYFSIVSSINVVLILMWIVLTYLGRSLSKKEAI